MQPRQELTTVDRGLSGNLWGSLSTWDKYADPRGGTFVLEDYTPHKIVSTVVLGETNDGQTDAAAAEGNHGIVRYDADQSAAQNLDMGTLQNVYIDPDLIDQCVVEVLTTLDEDGATGSTIDFIGLSSETDSLSNTSALTTDSGDNHLGLLIDASGNVDLVTKPNGGTTLTTLVDNMFTGVDKDAYNKYGIRLKRNGDGSFRIWASVNNNLGAYPQGIALTSAQVGTAVMQPGIFSVTPNSSPAQVAACNTDWRAVLNTTRDIDVQS